MDMDSERDLISDLPQSIIETILVKLPIRDAVMTSVLSSKWRYKWSSITQLVFDDNCVPNTCCDKSNVESNLIHFITRYLFLHDGPIHKFALSSSYLNDTPDIGQWLLFLSRKDSIEELSIELGCFVAPSYLFSCQKLTRLKLRMSVICYLEPPLSFKGFSCLKHLNLQKVHITRRDIENLISSCSLLEDLILSFFPFSGITIRAPKLKYLNLEGVKGIFLENTPNLVTISVSMYVNDNKTEHFEQSSGCNFEKFLGNVPHIEHLAGHINFTEYLGIGIEKERNPLVYCHLKVLELYQVRYESRNEILVILRLIIRSPNLEELRISGRSAHKSCDWEDADVWEKGLPVGCTFNKLKLVKITDFSAVLHEMAFIKFLLAHSPVLETMTVSPSPSLCTVDKQFKAVIELVSYSHASPVAKIQYA